MDIDIAWTPAGRAAARQLDLSEAAVIDVVYSSTSIYLVYPDSIWYVGAAGNRLITVLADRQSRNVSIFEITHVREPSPVEAKAWRSMQP
jgi:hypothetical protein